MFKTILFLLSFSIIASDSFNSKFKKLITNKGYDLSKQSFCLKNKDEIVSTNFHTKVRPASVSKLYTTLWAFEKLTHKYQFETKIYLKDNNLYIKGSNDPFFVTENLITIMGKLNQLSIDRIDHIFFDENFYLNWSKNPNKIAKNLVYILNTTSWKNKTYILKRNIDEYIAQYNLTLDTPTSFTLDKAKFQKSINTNNMELILSHLSSTLLDHFKQVNIYSNNFYTDSIFEKLGGAKAFNRYLYTKYKITKSDTYFYTGSGLGENYTTCKSALQILSSLKDYSKKNKIDLTKFISVAGVEGGTLANRFKNKTYVLAKTGTLRHTSTLAGYLGDDKAVSFAIFNHTQAYESKTKIRQIQDQIIEFIIKEYSYLKELNYTPFYYLPIWDTKIQ
ncbi:MAG: D-alanyl-D-alanine carboxypeptidase [Bacteriovoracaceae bacterium]|jgi:D-alanyl-D-alanine carboxypeptidase/D-alanyl-D-alanine-endopeptidase (penicillin-binding protein 4)|nr:D-alanyl-D-alanine carboxypeptidase [Bacteriovoracaceae bacterium]